MVTNGVNGTNGDVSTWRHYNEGTFMFTVSSYPTEITLCHARGTLLTPVSE